MFIRMKDADLINDIAMVAVDYINMQYPFR